MGEITVTCCDYCNSRADFHPLDGRGLLERSEEDAVEEFGWKRTPSGVKCQTCQEEEED